MTDPNTVDEYNARHRANLHFERVGMDAIAHLPCPFCAAADFMVCKLIEMTSALEAGATCGECGRSMRAIVKRGQGETRIDIMQSGGADPPGCMPKMRRVAT